MSSTSEDRKDKLADLITLTGIDGIGAGRFYLLVTAFGSVDKALAGSISELTDIPGIGREIASRIKESQNKKKSLAIVDDIIKREWNFFLYDDSDYPVPLKNIDDRPPYLFYLGDYIEADQKAVAIVGSRTASEDGRLFAENLAAALAENKIAVVSGMARGVDICAHRGAINAGGRTLAVFGCSLDILYPPEGKEIARKIINSGAIFSEYLPGTIPFAPNFPRRNRIISGLSQGVVVIEAAERSGALSTASHAMAQNREIFAVPGSPRSEMSKGTNKLIKAGAKLLTSVEDIFTELPRLRGEVKAAQIRKMDDLTSAEIKIIEILTAEPVHLDNLSRQLSSTIPDLMQILLALELKGIIKELSGKRYILN